MGRGPLALPHLLPRCVLCQRAPCLPDAPVCVCAALEKKMASRQGREELIKKGLLEMMEQGECEGRPGGAGCRARGRRAGRLVDPGASPGRNGSREAGIPRRPGPRGASTAGGVPES